MNKVLPIIIGLLLVARVGVLASNDWPGFRGRDAGVAPDHPDLPDSWSETGERRVESRHPGPGVELPSRLG